MIDNNSSYLLIFSTYPSTHVRKPFLVPPPLSAALVNVTQEEDVITRIRDQNTDKAKEELFLPLVLSCPINLVPTKKETHNILIRPIDPPDFLTLAHSIPIIPPSLYKRFFLPPCLQTSSSSDISPFLTTETSVTELAVDIEGSPEEEEDSSSGLTSDAVSVVLALYDALCSLDADTVHRLLAPDLEWWFHGPPTHQYLMRLLTGSSDEKGKLHYFAFVPETIASFGTLVIAEGFNKGRSVFWVHAWTVSDDGVITRVREYFNTSLTVTRFGGPESSSEIYSDPYRDSIWESSLSDQSGKSVPGLVLAL